jgi:hypothetical protein
LDPCLKIEIVGVIYAQVCFGQCQAVACGGWVADEEAERVVGVLKVADDVVAFLVGRVPEVGR